MLFVGCKAHNHVDWKVANNKWYVIIWLEIFFYLRIENKQDITNEEKHYIFRQVSEFIMSHSSKNGDIGRLQNEYESIFRTVNVK